MTEVAVIILNYNGKKFLHQFLPSVIRHSQQAQIIVADNGSTDDTIPFLTKEFPSVRVIASQHNLGFCGGYNYALKQVEAKYYILLNSDVEVTAGWIDPIIQLFEKDPRIGAIQPKILSKLKPDEFEYAGAAGGMIDTLGYPFCRGRIFNHMEKERGQYNDIVPVFWATGACLFVRAELYHQLGGLDEDYFAHMEEIDFCWRLQRAGHRVYYHGSSTVYHVGGGTLSSSSPRKTYYNFRNGLSLVFKHLPTSQLVWKLPFRILLDWVAAFKFLLQPSLPDALAVIKAHAHFLSGLGNEIRKRKKLEKELKSYEVHVFYPHFLVADYFLFGKDTVQKLGIINPKW
ncbi:MAG: glycosyltransferase family 2 protein [Cyclobacteriaceae bacterium]|jgi:GT2 family glycosyltransferase|nr:glycosyltransferase family 2 protein [Flammeovirgaceae bacterium]